MLGRKQGRLYCGVDCWEEEGRHSILCRPVRASDARALDAAARARRKRARGGDEGGGSAWGNFFGRSGRNSNDGSSSPKPIRALHRSMATFAMLFGLAGILCVTGKILTGSYFVHPPSLRSLRGAGDNSMSSILTMYEDEISGSSHSEERRHRILAILKTRWPECYRDGLTSAECKAIIDADIANMFTDEDRNITSHVVKVRSLDDESYNQVVISTTSASGGLTKGVFHDGMVYYAL